MHDDPEKRLEQFKAANLRKRRDDEMRRVLAELDRQRASGEMSEREWAHQRRVLLDPEYGKA